MEAIVKTLMGIYAIFARDPFIKLTLFLEAFLMYYWLFPTPGLPSAAFGAYGLALIFFTVGALLCDRANPSEDGETAWKGPPLPKAPALQLAFLVLLPLSLSTGISVWAYISSQVS